MKSKILLEPGDFKPTFLDWEVHGALNPGGVRLKNKKILLYVRVAEAPINTSKKMMKCPIIVSEKEYIGGSQTINRRSIISRDGNVIYVKKGICRLENISHFRRVFLDESGIKLERIENIPVFTGMANHSEYGVEDPRITKIGNKYYMTYVVVSLRDGVSTSLAVSKNLLTWVRKGIIFQEQNKDVVLFPEKIKGRYVSLNRPESSFHFSKPSIWISYSPDLIHWGREKALLRTRDGSWENERNGAGPPPIKTKYGWLTIYHGVKKNKKGSIYSAGAALLSLKNPEKILARTPKNKPLLSPKEAHEKTGFVSNVVFPTVAIPDLNKRDLLIYSGGADSVTTVRKISLKYIFKSMKKVTSSDD
jgi:beta-1,2-mannobiose phosphorylase / 1,2-beta-oligomannan phosphorylase